MTQTKPIVSIENVVASATVNQDLDLKQIPEKIFQSRVYPESFSGAVFRVKNPKTATLLFRTGKMVCTGAKSSEMARKVIGTVVNSLRKGGIKIKKDTLVTIQNMVAAVNLGGKINIEQAARTLPRSMYEPEQFPGLVHRMIEPKAMILVFASGKLVCTGCKEEKDVHHAVNQLHLLLEEKKLMNYS